jgi:tetratricopeptide (TPR) repeat protein
MKVFFLVGLLIIIWGNSANVRAQAIEMKLEEQMVALERDVVRIYNELQKFLSDDPARRGNELLAFESLITIYVDEVLNLYDTFWRMKGTTLESQQNIAARCLMFRALTYLERANKNSTNYAKACEDYKKALYLSQNKLEEPLLSSKLPHEVWVGKKLYTRLADLLDSRSKNFQMIECFRMTNGVSQFGDGK